MSTVRIDPTSDVYKDAGSGQNFTYVPSSPTTVYSEIDDGDTAVDTDYIKVAPISGWLNNPAIFIFGMSDPTPPTGQVPTSIDISVRINHDSVYAGSLRAYVALLWAGETSPPMSYDASGLDTAGSNTFSTVVLTIAIPSAHQNWTDINALRLAVKLAPASSNTISQLEMSWLKGVITAAKATTVDLAEADDTLTFAHSSDMRITVQGVKPAGVGSVAGSGLLGAAVPGQTASKKRFQVASDSGFATILGDTTELAATESAGTTLQMLLAWLPSVAGTYYARMGVGTADFPTVKWSAVQNIVVGFPANVSLSVVQDGQVLVMAVTLDDTYSKPPNVTFMVDADMAQPDAMTVTGSYTYTFTGRLKVTTGWHRVSCLVGNVWTVVNVAAISVYVPPLALPADVRVYQGDREVPAQHVHVSEPCLPEYCTATFDTPEPIQGAVVVNVQAGGLKRFPMEVTRVDGLTVTACSRLKRSLGETMTLSYLSIAMLDLLQLMVSPWIVQGRTDLITGTWDMLDTETTREDIVTQIATRCGVALAERDGTIVVLPAREDDLPEAALAVDAKDPTVTPSVNYDSIRNVIRQAYQLDRYPIPPNAATNHDAAQWTGTVSDVAVSASSIRPPSGSAYCFKGNGLCKRTVAFNKGDYDLLRFHYSPSALGQALEVRLYSDATNYWKLSKAYAGASGAGFTVLGTAQSDSVAQTITFTAARLSEVTIATTDTCIFHIELKSGATSLWTSGDNTTDAEGRTILVPEVVYKAGTADTMVITFTNLYAVGVSWGVVCSCVSGKEYYSYLTGTPSADVIDWTDSKTYTVGVTGILNLPTTQTITLPVHPAAPVRTVPSGCLIGGQRYYLHVLVYSYAGGTTGALERTFDMGLPPVAALPSYGRAFIQDSQLYIDEFGGQVAMSTPEDEAWVIQLCADITLYTLKAAVVTVTVWDYRDWSYGTTYPLWEDVTLKLSEFTASGSPTNAIIAYGLYAATDYYVDELYVERTTPRWQWVEVQDDDSIAQWGTRALSQKTGDAHSASSALALAAGMLEDLKDPAQEYQAVYPMTIWLALGDSVSVGSEVLSVASISYGEGLMTASIGQTTGNLRDTLLSLARRQDALEREL